MFFFIKLEVLLSIVFLIVVIRRCGWIVLLQMQMFYLVDLISQIISIY